MTIGSSKLTRCFVLDHTASRPRKVGMVAMSGKLQRLSIDQVLAHVGEYGKFQILLNAILCVLKVPFGNILLIPYFSQHNPPWRCVRNSSFCLLNGIYDAKSENYTYRCSLPRSEWEYTQPKEYSVVTQVT